MIQEGPRIQWEPGDRVTREQYLDDGTWLARGDECLCDSPLMTGSVTSVKDDGGIQVATVKWDCGGICQYYEHGIDPESV